MNENIVIPILTLLCGTALGFVLTLAKDSHNVYKNKRTIMNALRNELIVIKNSFTTGSLNMDPEPKLKRQGVLLKNYPFIIGVYEAEKTKLVSFIFPPENLSELQRTYLIIKSMNKFPSNAITSTDFVSFNDDDLIDELKVKIDKCIKFLNI